MPGRVFLDTNIIIYVYSDKEPDKRDSVYKILDEYECITSIQVFNEASNVWFKKLDWSGEKIQVHLDNIELVCSEVLSVGRNTVNKALRIKDLYKFSYYDSLMLASALEGSCGIIFTEDMRDEQIIDKSLKIINPFKRK